MFSKQQFVLWFVFTFIFFSGFAQNAKLCDDLIPFGEHLFETGSYHDIIQISYECPFGNYKPAAQDSLNFILGNALLKLNQTDSAISVFLKIHSVDKFRLAGIKSGFNNFLDDRTYSKPLKWLQSSKINVSEYPGLAYYNGGLYLLRNDIFMFDSLMNEMPLMSVDDRKLLRKYRMAYENMKQKSPWIAGLLSTAAPGLGKIYAGKPYQGISSFITVGIFALQAWEAYYRNGIRSPVLYINGTIAFGYYISNIWGSVMAAKIRNQEVKHEIDQDLHRQLYFDL